MPRDITTRYVRTVGRIDDPADTAAAIARRLNWRTNGARAVLVYVVGGDVYAANRESDAAQAVPAEAIVGLYLRGASFAQIEGDLIAWTGAEAKAA